MPRGVLEMISNVVCIALFITSLAFDFTILMSVAVIIGFWRVSGTSDSADLKQNAIYRVQMMLCFQFLITHMNDFMVELWRITDYLGVIYRLEDMKSNNLEWNET